MPGTGIVTREAMEKYEQLLSVYAAALQNEINYINQNLNAYADATHLDDNYKDHSKIWSELSARIVKYITVIDEQKALVARTKQNLFP